MKTTRLAPAWKGRAALAAGLLIASLGTTLASPAAATPAITVTDDGAVFPFDDSFPRPTVPVRIGDHGPFLFILDTGAGATVVDEGLAKELGLRTLGSQRIGSPLGPGEDRPIVGMSDVHVGPLSVPDFRATTFDLRGMIGTALSSAKGTGGDAGATAIPLGVLSTSDLGERIVTFDVGARTVKISVGALPQPDGLNIFEYEGTHPAVPVQIGVQRFEAHIDTGAPGGITLPLSVAKSLPLQGELAVIGEARLVDATVQVHGAKLDGFVRVGGIELENPQLAFLEGAKVGNIGNEFLAQCVLTVDPRSQRVQLVAAGTRASHASAPQATTRVRVTGAPDDASGPVRRTVTMAKGKKRYGIRMVGGLSESPIRVAGVDDGSPAAAAGLRAGDLIEQLNGVGVEAMEQADRIAALRGSPLELLVRRGDELLALSMSLE